MKTAGITELGEQVQFRSSGVAAQDCASGDNAGRIVKPRLTLQARRKRAATAPQARRRSSIFSRISHEFRLHLDGSRATNHCAAMNGLNHICGICPEIIR